MLTVIYRPRSNRLHLDQPISATKERRDQGLLHGPEQQPEVRWQGLHRLSLFRQVLGHLVRRRWRLQARLPGRLPRHCRHDLCCERPEQLHLHQLRDLTDWCFGGLRSIGDRRHVYVLTLCVYAVINFGKRRPEDENVLSLCELSKNERNITKFKR